MGWGGGGGVTKAQKILSERETISAFPTTRAVIILVFGNNKLSNLSPLNELSSKLKTF